MTKFYIEMFDNDYILTERNRETGKDETVFFNSYSEAEIHILKEGFMQSDFDIYETVI